MGWRRSSVRFSRCLCQETVWIEDRLVSCFKLVMEIIKGGVYDEDGKAFLKRERVGFARSGFMIIHVDQCPFMDFDSI